MTARVYTSDGTRLKGMGREIIPAGQSMILETAGGGGRGAAKNRNEADIEKDRLSGLVKDP